LLLFPLQVTAPVGSGPVAATRAVHFVLKPTTTDEGVHDSLREVGIWGRVVTTFIATEAQKLNAGTPILLSLTRTE
jgi:hypothetical protein